MKRQGYTREHAIAVEFLTDLRRVQATT
jgi:hypothetical protein